MKMDQELLSSAQSGPLHEHPLYIKGIELRDAGQWRQAFETFQMLQGAYPHDAELNEVFDQIHMRTTMAHFQVSNKATGSRRGNSRKIILGLLLIVIVATAGYVAYEFWIDPVIVHELRVRQTASLRSNADEAIAAGDYALARQTLQELSNYLPEDPATIETLLRIERVERSSELYATAKTLIARADWGQAVEVLIELQTLDAQYRDVPQLLRIAQESQALEQQFRIAESAFAAEEWVSAITQYEALRQTSVSFKFEEIQARIFESHLSYGRSLVQKAGNDLELVTTALHHFSEALLFKPVDSEALRERRLAEMYIAALNSQDRDELVELLQAIYDEQPDYAGNSAVQLLYFTLLERAESAVDSGNKDAGIADYQIAARLQVKNPEEAQVRLLDLTSVDIP
jgi:tetratricopeptide (TPR) repeat protein